MADEKKDDKDNAEGGVYKVDTVPPPAGEDDAYSAPTKVGPMGDAFVKNLMKDAEQRTAALTRKNEEEKKKEPAPVSKRPIVLEESPPSSKAPVSAGGTPLPRVYDEEEEDAATVLSPKAKPPALPQRPTALQVPDDGAQPPTLAPPPVPPAPAVTGGLGPPAAPGAPAQLGVMAPAPPDPHPPLPPLAPMGDRGPIPFEPGVPEPAAGNFDRRALVVALVGLFIFVIGLVMLLTSRS